MTESAMKLGSPVFAQDGVEIFHSDCREVLRSLADGSVRCCVTSPPYFALRNYGHDDQIGLEDSPADYIAEMIKVFREVQRVLADDGTLWLNIGDSYCSSDKWGGSSGGKNYTSAAGGFPRSRTGKDCDPKRGDAANGQPKKMCAGDGLKPKDLVGIPWMLAFALRADGWYLRQEIIWHKPAPMPESCRDRCTKAHESIFLLAKSPRYYFDAAAISEESQGSPNREPHGWAVGADDHSAVAHNTPGKHRKVNGGACFGKQRQDVEGTGAQSRTFERPVYDKRNKRSVWTVASEGFDGAHFATFPRKLIEPCILAGSAKGDLVLDPFFGSGTTGQVCRDLGRRCVGIELNLDYIELAKKRFTQRILF